MKQYKGYYIDHVYFNSEAEIDAFVEKKAVEAYKMAIELFASAAASDLMARSIYADEKAEALVNQFGYTWEQVEEIETSVYKNIA